MEEEEQQRRGKGWLKVVGGGAAATTVLAAVGTVMLMASPGGAPPPDPPTGNPPPLETPTPPPPEGGDGDEGLSDEARREAVRLRFEKMLAEKGMGQLLGGAAGGKLKGTLSELLGREAGELLEVYRYPTIESPDRVDPGAQFSVLVSLTTDKIVEGVKVESGKQDDEGRLGLALAADQDEWTLEAILSAPGFELKSPNARPLVLPKQGDSTMARFDLVAKKGGEADRPLRVTFWHDGTYLARVSRIIRVGAPAATADTLAEEPKEHGGARPLVEFPTVGADLTAFVTYRPETHEHDVLVNSPYFAPKSATYSSPEDFEGWLQGKFDGLARIRPRGAAPLAPDTPAPAVKGKPLAVAKMKGIGTSLWNQHVPPVFRDMFWAVRKKVKGRRLRIQIMTNDPTLPWELVRPTRDGESLDFLGIETELARWHVSQAGQIYDRPPQSAPLEQVIAVAPAYAGAEALPNQAIELSNMTGLPGFTRVGDLDAAVATLMLPPNHGVLHFSGHGIASGAPPTTEYALKFRDMELDLMTFRGLEQAHGRHPLYFVNACDLGQAQHVAGFVDGWAPTVLERGASGYIGGLWPLSDVGAADFSRAFYARLGESLESDGRANVAAALAESRKLFYETGDPTYLAYAYYGDPAFGFTRTR